MTALATCTARLKVLRPPCPAAGCIPACLNSQNAGASCQNIHASAVGERALSWEGSSETSFNFMKPCNLRGKPPQAPGTYVYPLAGCMLVEMGADEVVTGDVVVVEAGEAAADLVLVSGEAVVEESAITGEDTPLNRSALDLHHLQHHHQGINRRFRTASAPDREPGMHRGGSQDGGKKLRLPRLGAANPAPPPWPPYSLVRGGSKVLAASGAKPGAPCLGVVVRTGGSAAGVIS